MTIIENVRPAWTCRPVRVGLLALLLLLAGCGGSGDSNLTQCGNSRIDDGEQCDDGNSDDSDACTAVCRFARCGDGAIQSGTEVCDGVNLGSRTLSCGSLGYASGDGGHNRPLCMADCASFDLSVCGAQFTPSPVRPPTLTPTPSATPTPTAIRTSTPTPRATTCGDHLLETGETCQQCPADCQAAPCTADGTTAPFVLILSADGAPTQVSLQLAYRSSVVSIPGTGDERSVKLRVRPTPNVFTVNPNDLNYAVDIFAMRAPSLPSAPDAFVTVTFDRCAGAAAPTVDDLSCVVQSCTDALGTPLANCGCTAAVRP